jgi:ABC-2 type transport system permease protein
MAEFKVVFINEIERMCKKKKALVALIISIAAIVLGQLIVVGVRNGFNIRGTSSLQFPLLVLSVFVYTILPLFTALVAIDIFSSEFSQNTMKILIVRPAARFKIFLAKIAAIGVFALANLLLVMILAFVSGLLFNSSSMSFMGIIKVIVAYIVSIWPIMTIALLIVLFTNIFKSGVAVFFLSVLIFIVLVGLSIFFSKYSNLFIVGILRWYGLWIADVIPISEIIREFLILLGCDIMLFTAGFYLFDKKEF